MVIRSMARSLPRAPPYETLRARVRNGSDHAAARDLDVDEGGSGPDRLPERREKVHQFLCALDLVANQDGTRFARRKSAGSDHQLFDILCTHAGKAHPGDVGAQLVGLQGVQGKSILLLERDVRAGEADPQPVAEEGAGRDWQRTAPAERDQRSRARRPAGPAATGSDRDPCSDHPTA